MKHVARVAVLGIALLAICLPLAAQTPDFTGTWTLQTNGYLPDENIPCVYEGTVQFSQTGPSEWVGPATLTLVSGPPACPAEMMATCTGGLDGGTFGGTLDGGDMYGFASFSGTEVTAGKIKGTLGDAPDGAHSKATLAAKAGWQGGFTTSTGPFSGTSGTFVAMRQSVLEIPTLTETGLLLMAILLMASAVYFLVRGRNQAV